ncbi:hypothetical protein MTO96_041093 [Rhipicephalus appendiculatus]
MVPVCNDEGKGAASSRWSAGASAGALIVSRRVPRAANDGRAREPRACLAANERPGRAAFGRSPRARYPPPLPFFLSFAISLGCRRHGLQFGRPVSEHCLGAITGSGTNGPGGRVGLSGGGTPSGKLRAVCGAGQSMRRSRAVIKQ